MLRSNNTGQNFISIEKNDVGKNIFNALPRLLAIIVFKQNATSLFSKIYYSTKRNYYILRALENINFLK